MGKISKNFNRLLDSAGYKNCFDFHKKTGFPYSSAYELAHGVTTSPKLGTLQELAKHLDLEIGKLLCELTK